MDLIKNPSDPRPESFRIKDINSIKITKTIDKKHDWYERRKLLLNNIIIYKNLELIIDKANKNEFSLALFKPTKIIDFIVEKTEPEWDKKLVEKIYSDIKTTNII
jgi:hypothetical protein